MMGWPNIAETFWRMGRAKTSPSDPASRGTIKVIGFTGYCSAAHTQFSKQNTPEIKKRLNIRIYNLFISVLPSLWLRIPHNIAYCHPVHPG
jgi:hypothetical protein